MLLTFDAERELRTGHEANTELFCAHVRAD